MTVGMNIARFRRRAIFGVATNPAVLPSCVARCVLT